MRKIEEQMCEACKFQKDWRLDNTIVEREERENGVYMRVALYGNEIAMIDYEHAVVMVRHCGYMTNTTKSRLNALLRFFCGMTISVKKREWKLNGEAVEARRFTDCPMVLK